jgi:spore coat polysaccharide biosynthesis protein SpsF (cytidylyltransferase family)
MKRVAIIQARMSSSRFPGKVLQRIGEMPMIVFMLHRVARAALLDQIVVATSTDHSDDALTEEVRRSGFDCLRGDLLDVLSRFNAAANSCSADVVVRLTGDCPLIDVDLIDKAVATLISGKFDYVSNVEPPTYPNGLDVEAFTQAALAEANARAESASDREHVTPYIRRNKALFKHMNLRSIWDMSSLRWTVDHADDLALIRAMVAGLPGGDPSLADRFDFLRVFETRRAELPDNQHARMDYHAGQAPTPVDRMDQKLQQ